MSQRNSAAAKQQRRAERNDRKLTPQSQSRTIHHLIPLGEGHRRVFGSCVTCQLSYEVRSQSEGALSLDLEHECLLEFFTEQQSEDIKETARLLIEKNAENYPDPELEREEESNELPE